MNWFSKGGGKERESALTVEENAAWRSHAKLDEHLETIRLFMNFSISRFTFIDTIDKKKDIKDGEKVESR